MPRANLPPVGKARGKYQPRPPSKRNEQIRAAYARGVSVSELARWHDLSRQRIHQIVNG